MQRPSYPNRVTTAKFYVSRDKTYRKKEKRILIEAFISLSSFNFRPTARTLGLVSCVMFHLCRLSGEGAVTENTIKHFQSSQRFMEVSRNIAEYRWQFSEQLFPMKEISYVTSVVRVSLRFAKGIVEYRPQFCGQLPYGKWLRTMLMCIVIIQ